MPRIQYKNFKLLQDVVKTFAKKLSIQLRLADIKDDKIKLIKSLIGEHVGSQNLSFIVYDDDEKIMVEMESKKYKLNISPKLLHELEKKDILYKLI